MDQQSAGNEAVRIYQWLITDLKRFFSVLVNNECLQDSACFAGKQHVWNGFWLFIMDVSRTWNISQLLKQHNNQHRFAHRSGRSITYQGTLWKVCFPWDKAPPAFAQWIFSGVISTAETFQEILTLSLCWVTFPRQTWTSGYSPDRVPMTDHSDDSTKTQLSEFMGLALQSPGEEIQEYRWS